MRLKRRISDKLEIFRFLLERNPKHVYNWWWSSKYGVSQTPEIVNMFKEKQPLPSKIWLEITTKCNLRCVMCEHTYWKEPEINMTYEKFISIIGQFPHLRNVMLTGIGESTLNPDFAYMIRELRYRNISVEITSNFTNTLPERIVKNVDRLNVSLDGAFKETYEKIRVGAKWENVLRNIRIAGEMKGNSYLPLFDMHFIVCSENLSDIVHMPRMIREQKLPVRELTYTRMLHNFPEASKYYTEVPGECIEQTEAMGRKYGVDIKWGLEIKKKLPYSRCMCFMNPFIYANGNITLCGSMPENNDRSICMGNIYKTSMPDLWYTKLYREARNMKKVCPGCPLYE